MRKEGGIESGAPHEKKEKTEIQLLSTTWILLSFFVSFVPSPVTSSLSLCSATFPAKVKTGLKAAENYSDVGEEEKVDQQSRVTGKEELTRELGAGAERGVDAGNGENKCREAIHCGVRIQQGEHDKKNLRSRKERDGSADLRGSPLSFRTSRPSTLCSAIQRENLEWSFLSSHLSHSLFSPSNNHTHTHGTLLLLFD